MGIDALSLKDRLKMEAARSLREDYLQQNAFHETDTYASGKKQVGMLKLVLEFYRKASAALEQGADFSDIAKLPVREAIGRAKYVEEKDCLLYTSDPHAGSRSCPGADPPQRKVYRGAQRQSFGKTQPDACAARY